MIYPRDEITSVWIILEVIYPGLKYPGVNYLGVKDPEVIFPRDELSYIETLYFTGPKLTFTSLYGLKAFYGSHRENTKPLTIRGKIPPSDGILPETYSQHLCK